MSFDFNRTGQQYQAVAVGRSGGFGMLARGPAVLLETLRVRQAREYAGASTERQRALLGAAGCLDRLEGFLFQLSRVAEHARSLRSGLPKLVGVPAPEPGSMAVLSADEACYDFEGLLFQARASLDRLTGFISGQHNQRCNRFTKLRTILTRSIAADPRAQAIVDLLDGTDKFDGVLIDTEGAKALRSVIAHYSSVAEGRQIAFTIHFTLEGRRLIFDCEALGRPLFATAETLGVHIPFLVLNAVAIYSGIAQISLDEFKPMWTNPSVSFTKYRDETAGAIRVTVANMHPDGFTVTTHSVRREILDRAIP